MPSNTQRHGLVRQYTRWLTALFLALELVTVAAGLWFVFRPMAERAADDLAGLMVLSAQTWTELPPGTRPVFEQELIEKHHMALRPQMAPAPDIGLRHGLYIHFLERAFERRLGREAFFLSDVGTDGSDWLWIAVPAGGQSIGVGFATSRMQLNPLGAIAIALIVGTLLVVLLARWMASRIAGPVARLELAAAQMAEGASPALLPETGPRELAELSRHFNHMALQVRELSDARTTLFAGLSHDLRTPLARMRLAVELLTLKPNPELVQRIEQDIEEMNQLIGQLLGIARGLNVENAEELDVCEWLQARVAARHNEAEASGARLSVQCAKGLHMLAPPGMLARVVDNLIGNAIRYAPGPIEVVAKVRSTDVPDRHTALRIAVLDRGPGIPQSQRAAVFRPFHRIDEARSSELGGFGLGLAIVQQLAHANGWTAGLDAREGGGLVAWIELNQAPLMPRGG